MLRLIVLVWSVVTYHLCGAEHDFQWNEEDFADDVRTLVATTLQLHQQNTEVCATEIERHVAATFCTTPPAHASQ